MIALRRDRGAMVLSFVLPLAFFSIFAVIFGRNNNSTPTVKLIVVDQDQSRASQALVSGLKNESSLVVMMKPGSEKKNAPPLPDYTAATAEGAVKAGDAPVALIIPAGFGQHPSMGVRCHVHWLPGMAGTGVSSPGAGWPSEWRCNRSRRP